MDKVQFKEIKGLLTEILKWQRFANFEVARQKILDVLSEDERKIVVYNNLKPEMSTRKLGDLVGVSHKTIQNWQEEWFEKAIAGRSKRGKKGGHDYWKLFDLEDLGIEIPEIKSKSKEQRKKLKEGGSLDK